MGFAIHCHESATGVHMYPILNAPPTSPHPIPLGHYSAPALSTLSDALNLDWQFISHMIYTCFDAILPNHPPSPSPTESKRMFDTSVSVLLSHIQGYLYHLSKFNIYALVYCIGVFLSVMQTLVSLTVAILRCELIPYCGFDLYFLDD